MIFIAKRIFKNRKIKSIKQKRNWNLTAHTCNQIEKNYISLPGGRLDRFATGCLQTLKIDRIYEEVKHFYELNYSSNLMSLVIVGNKSLEKLQKFVV